MISNNEKGNPNHDAEGKFTSAGNTGVGTNEAENSQKKKLTDGPNPFANFPGFESTAKLWDSLMESAQAIIDKRRNNNVTQKNEEKEFDVVTTEGENLGTVKAASEDEAYEKALESYRGPGAELTVEEKLNKMGFGPDKNV